MDIKLKKIQVENFRNFKNVSFEIGKKITAISGQNGVGKSNLVSLIASGSGLSRKSDFGSNFQPEFYDFFNVDLDEPFSDYRIHLTYESADGEEISKRLSFKDDTATGRGIRIIPRTSNTQDQGKQREHEKYIKEKYGIGGAARIPIPTIYLSISRLYPLGERKDSVTIKPIKKTAKLCQNEADEKFKEWYNAVIPGTIKDDAELSMIEKKESARASLHMEMEHTPTLSQSVGQDNIGNIISALVDIYLLSKQEEYNGAIICIDEVEVSLHPDTQLNLLSLFDKVSEELNIQIVVSTHSLTVLKELLRKQEKNPEDYSIIYLKNPSAPMVTEQRSYELLKADLLGKTTFDRPKTKIYFEDTVGRHIFGLLVKALCHQCDNIESGEDLRGDCYAIEKPSVHKKIMSFQKYCRIENQLLETVVSLGCDELIKISKADNYFDRVIILLDGDARRELPAKKPKVKDYLDKEVDAKGETDRAHKKTVCFLPNYFAPESFIYRIIYQLVNDEMDHTVFWRTLDQKEDTALYTPSKLKGIFSGLPEEFNNEDLKKIFGEYHDDFKHPNSEIWNFVDNTGLLDYYYGSYNTINELIDFFADFEVAYKIARSKTLANRYA